MYSWGIIEKAQQINYIFKMNTKIAILVYLQSLLNSAASFTLQLTGAS